MTIHYTKTITLPRQPRLCPRLLAIILLASAATLLLLPAMALDMSRLQASINKLGGNLQSFMAWKKLLRDDEGASAANKLQHVNEFFNQRIEFGNDPDIWGQVDYWATPMETLAKGKGDCEDYVIAKYFTLINLNIPAAQLRLIYANARIGSPGKSTQQAHMVLAYYATPDAEPLILDNLIAEIRPAAGRPDLQPVFSFNSLGMFGGAGANAKLAAGGTSRLSRWHDLLQRARQEGFD